MGNTAVTGMCTSSQITELNDSPQSDPAAPGFAKKRKLPSIRSPKAKHANFPIRLLDFDFISFFDDQRFRNLRCGESRIVQNVFGAGEGFHHGGETESRGGKENGVPDFGGRAAGFNGAAGVAVDGAFELAADRDGEFDEGASFRIERAGFSSGVAEGVIGGEDFREIFLEFEIAAGEFSGRRRFGFAHGTEGCGFARGRQVVQAIDGELCNKSGEQFSVATSGCDKVFRALVGEL
jgi:hypothetical protein